MRTVRLGVLAILCGLLAACASGPVKVLPEKTYYDQAKQAMNSGNFKESLKNLEDLETYYPFGRYAEQAQLDLIYARYQSLDLEGARSAAERFLRLHPQSSHADYALYMKGMASYNLDYSLAEQYFPIEVGARDPGQQREAFRDFSELLNRFPNSEYAPDARKRMEAIRNRLAKLELVAARYYIKRQAYVAASNRASFIVTNYPHSPEVEEALPILIETDRKLGMKDAANHAVEMLAENFPKSPWLDKNQHYITHVIKPENRSLLSVVTFGLLGSQSDDDQSGQ